MKQDTFDTSSRDEEEHGIALQSRPVEQSSPVSLRAEAACQALSVSALAARCLEEIDNYRRGEPWTDEYGLELLRFATVQGNQEAWAWVQHCFSGLVRSWLRRHPKREVVCRLESDENYVAQAFERFWQATTLTPMWNSIRWLPRCNTCERVLMEPFWIRCVPMPASRSLIAGARRAWGAIHGGCD